MPNGHGQHKGDWDTYLYSTKDTKGAPRPCNQTGDSFPPRSAQEGGMAQDITVVRDREGAGDTGWTVNPMC